MAVVAGLAGGSILNATTANAATTGTTTSSADTTGSATTAAATTDTNSSGSSSASGGMQTPPDPTKGGHVGQNGTKEEVLTGDTLTKAEDAAKAAVSGATVLRAETDAEGAAYEVHMQKSDGSYVTVKLDSGFNVTGTGAGFN